MLFQLVNSVHEAGSYGIPQSDIPWILLQKAFAAGLSEEIGLN
jgi:hypothetical protein